MLSPWKTVTPINTPTWTLERNPYSVFVDTAGNQLPYIDKVVLTLAENLEVLNLRAIAGEYDYASRHVDLGKLPVFIENQQKGNYKVYLDPGDYCGDLIIKFNLNYDADPEIGKWFNTADFRRALVARHRPRPDQRDVLARHGHAGLRGARGQQQVQPRAAVPEAVGDARRQEGQRDARQDRARQEGRARATACARTARAGCASRS